MRAAAPGNCGSREAAVESAASVKPDAGSSPDAASCQRVACLQLRIRSRSRLIRAGWCVGGPCTTTERPQTGGASTRPLAFTHLANSCKD